VANHPASACLAATAVRCHWHVENTLHYTRDVTFQEDQSPIRHDALGNPVAFDLTLIGDKAFDAQQRVIDPLTCAGKAVVIPPKANRKVSRDYDRDLYKARHLIENFFAKLKQFRAIATRYDKTSRNFLAAIHLTATVIWLN